jgi:hypothetical protein
MVGCVKYALDEIMCLNVSWYLGTPFLNLPASLYVPKLSITINGKAKNIFDESLSPSVNT